MVFCPIVIFLNGPFQEKNQLEEKGQNEVDWLSKSKYLYFE